jgi:hypothetical protein
MENYISRRKLILLLITIIILGLISICIKSFLYLSSEKITALMPIIIVFIGVFPSAIVIIITEIIKYKTNLKILEQTKKDELLNKRIGHYTDLLNNIEGFYIPENEVLKGEFFKNFRVAWLYSDDNVIQAINNFLESVNKDNGTTTQEKRIELFKKIQFEMRKDIIALKPLEYTNLTAKDVSNVGRAR